ncbi:hypothetical protein Cgig2_027930 [Carnegiea gigantea]|uniref:Protein kinase domain-containing protein n=1 Tax=Carnegiea gigantea TaxID=171969 RepID=A0A9Q1KLP8_9CARY|nr:hypothetical protein Cgig2_027930 [Carnegiea gigantea]
MSKTAMQFLRILHPIFSLLLTFHPFWVISQSPASDREILLNIKKQWGNQPSLQSWDSTTSHCQWLGIQCTGGKTVTGISLENKDIAGEIPESICDLKNLTTLDLGGNTLSGEFPVFLYKCANLQTLVLSQNLFAGQLPNDINKLSPQLRYLDLSSNNFTGDIPITIAQLKGLQFLNLGSNLFNGTFPSGLANLVNLEELLLAYNPFSPMKLPKEFGMLKSLKYLWMTDCNLIGEVPESFANLSSLEQLDLVQNNLVGEIPGRLFLLKNLTFLYLYRNKLSGGLPTSIEALNLKEIDVSNNNLTGIIPEGIATLPKLEVLNLFNNQFHGVLPLNIGKIPTLTTLKIWSNSFSGPLPPELGLHSRLEDFEVSDNGFTGQLPENLCSNKGLWGVVAANNRLNGSIPSSLGQCNSLHTVQLQNNSFSGEVPEGLWTLQNVSIMQLSDNQLSGQLPDKFAWNLTRVEISNNRFAGNIPQSVKNWRNLVVFEASNNLISGTIPLDLTSLPGLNILLLDRNQLSGELPSDIISWKSLTNLNIASNKLSGPIPPALGSLPVLNSLDLSNNQFSGQIPPELGNLKLTSLNLSSNKLSGGLPYGLDNNVYEDSFWNTRLCSNNEVSNLPKCTTYHRKNANNLSSKLLALILSLGLAALLAALYFTWFTIKKLGNRGNKEELETWKLISFYRVDFTEEKILANLTESNLIGSGAHGKVYRIPTSQSGDSVAVKKIWRDGKMSNISEKDLLAEVQILSTIRHLNIVKLLCCVSSEDSKLLVYEYMENQSLDKWIPRGKERPISSSHGLVNQMGLGWPTRLRIAIGAAQGLSYMHHDCSPPIIHRDIKSSNILLDANFNAKIADFGLAKMLPKPEGQPHTVSAVAGSFGYMAPEYCYTNKVNEKIDVYSFGVVLLELVTGKEPHRGDENSNLAEWAWRHYCEGRPIVEALDKGVQETCYMEEMTNVFKIGLMCTSTLPSSRPSMKEVLQVLRHCNALEGCGRKDSRNEHDFAPLLGSGNRYDSNSLFHLERSKVPQSDGDQQRLSNASFESD